MATRCTISREFPDGTIEARYCHKNGFPDWTGFVLADKFRSRKDVDRLFAGNEHITCLEKDGSIEFFESDENETPFVYEDWDDFESHEFIAGDPNIAYLYVFKMITQEWFYIDLTKDECVAVRLTFPSPGKITLWKEKETENV